MRYIYLTLLVTLLQMPCAVAQRAISYRLVLFGKGEITNNTYVNGPKSKGVVRAIPGYVGDPTKAVLRKNQYLDFFKQDDKEGGTQAKPDFTVEVPPRADKDLLVILYQDGSEVNQRVLDLKAAKMKKGERALINFLSVPVAVRFSDPDGEQWGDPTEVKAGAMGRIPSPGHPTVSWEVSSKPLKSSAEINQTGEEAEEPDEESAADEWVVFRKGVVMTSEEGHEILCTYLREGDKRPTFEMIRIHDVK